MQTETFILEERDYGKAQQAYDQYPQVEKEYQKKLDNYRKAISELESKKISSISIDEMMKADQLANEAETINKKYNELKIVINEEIERLKNEGRQKESIFEYNSNQSQESIEKIQHARLLMADAKQLQEEKNFIMAIEKAHMANECFDVLVSNINNKWIGKHKQNLEVLLM